MYEAKKEMFSNINQTKIANIVGIRFETLNRIINKKQTTNKTTAYCIVKAIDPNAEIEKYFKRNGE